MNFDAIIRENLVDPASSQVSLQLADARAVEDRALFDSILLGVLSCVVPPAVWTEAISRATTHYKDSRGTIQ